MIGPEQWPPPAWEPKPKAKLGRPKIYASVKDRVRAFRAKQKERERQKEIDRLTKIMSQAEREEAMIRDHFVAIIKEYASHEADPTLTTYYLPRWPITKGEETALKKRGICVHNPSKI